MITERNYLQILIEYIDAGKITRFYHWGIWKRTKRQILKEQNNECQICKGFGNYSPAECVHHIKELKDNPELAIEPTNLIALCHRHHDAVHFRLPEQINERKRDYVNEERW